MRILIYLFILIGCISLSSCSYFRPSIMFKTPSGYNFSEYIDSIQKEYVLRENDIFTLNVYSNDGFRLIDMANGSNNSGTPMMGVTNMIQYSIGLDQFVRLPVLGKINITGLSIRDAELFLATKYAEFYNNPFVMMNVINKRVIIFPGAEGTATVLPLVNQNTTLIEALALAGGISEMGKAKKVKLIRGNHTNPSVYLFDLSKIEGIRQAGITLQANDIIYVEPIFRPSQEFLQEISPFLSLLTTTLTLIVTINVLTK